MNWVLIRKNPHVGFFFSKMIETLNSSYIVAETLSLLTFFICPAHSSGFKAEWLWRYIYLIVYRTLPIVVLHHIRMPQSMMKNGLAIIFMSMGRKVLIKNRHAAAAGAASWICVIIFNMFGIEDNFHFVSNFSEEEKIGERAACPEHS